MSHFRTIILRNTLISMSLILLMAGCEPEPLLDDSPSDANHSNESDAAWNEDSWWDKDVAANNDAANTEDRDTEHVENDAISGPDTEDLPNADNPDFEVVADTLRHSCGTSGCHGAAAQGNFAMSGGMNATNSQVRIALEGIKAEDGTMLIEPGDADLSEIYLRLITTDRNESMPPAPFPALEQNKIDAIRDWIDSGAPYE